MFVRRRNAKLEGVRSHVSCVLHTEFRDKPFFSVQRGAGGDTTTTEGGALFHRHAITGCLWLLDKNRTVRPGSPLSLVTRQVGRARREGWGRRSLPLLRSKQTNLTLKPPVLTERPKNGVHNDVQQKQGRGERALISCYISVQLTDILLLELSRHVSLHEGGLSDTAVPDQDQLKLGHFLRLI